MILFANYFLEYSKITEFWTPKWLSTSFWALFSSVPYFISFNLSFLFDDSPCPLIFFARLHFIALAYPSHSQIFLISSSYLRVSCANSRFFISTLCHYMNRSAWVPFYDKNYFNFRIDVNFWNQSRTLWIELFFQVWWNSEKYVFQTK